MFPHKTNFKTFEKSSLNLFIKQDIETLEKKPGAMILKKALKIQKIKIRYPCSFDSPRRRSTKTIDVHHAVVSWNGQLPQ